MGRNLSPILRRELANLDKDAESRRTAMKTLKSYVKELDSKAIPLFLAQVSETNETCSLSGECTISLYEVLARVHGVKIVPLIDNIMATIIKTLASSAGSFPLQQACSKVVPAIARYGIDPTTPEEKKRHVIHSVCIPLCDSLLGSQESLTSGAALCLKALVDSDNWRFASHEMVNKVCQNVAGALEEKSTQTNSHMGLVMTLAKRNARTVEPYARILVHSGRKILNLEIVEGGSQKRLSAIQMINFLMKCLDPWCILSEVHLIIEEMEKCQFDQMPYVRGAAFEALQTAKKLASEKGLKIEKSSGSVTGSNFSMRRNISNGFGDVTPTSVSPESQTLDSFMEYESMVGSPVSTRRASQNSEYDHKSVNRKLWRYDNGGVDVSLKDGFFPELARGNSISDTYSIHSENHDKFNDNGGDCSNEFAGFFQNSPGFRLSRSTTNSPMRSRSNINAENIIFKTPRKLVHSLQDLNDTNSDLSDNNNNNNSRGRRLRRSLSSGHFDWAPPAAVALYRDDHHHHNNHHHDDGFCVDDVMNSNDQDDCTGENENANMYVQGGSESVASTNDIILGDVDIRLFSQESKSGVKTLQCSGVEKMDKKKKKKKTGLKLVCGFSFVLVVVFTPLLWIIEHENQGHFLVPT